MSQTGEVLENPRGKLGLCWAGDQGRVRHLRMVRRARGEPAEIRDVTSGRGRSIKKRLEVGSVVHMWELQAPFPFGWCACVGRRGDRENGQVVSGQAESWLPGSGCFWIPHGGRWGWNKRFKGPTGPEGQVNRGYCGRCQAG